MKSKIKTVRASLAPDNTRIAYLCSRWRSLQNTIREIKNQFQVGSGTKSLFKRLQNLTEEYDQLDRLLTEIFNLDREMIKKSAA